MVKIIKLNLVVHDKTKFEFKFKLKSVSRMNFTTALIIPTLFRDNTLE